MAGGAAPQDPGLLGWAVSEGGASCTAREGALPQPQSGGDFPPAQTPIVLGVPPTQAWGLWPGSTRARGQSGTGWAWLGRKEGGRLRSQAPSKSLGKRVFCEGQVLFEGRTLQHRVSFVLTTDVWNQLRESSQVSGPRAKASPRGEGALGSGLRSPQRRLLLASARQRPGRAAVPGLGVASAQIPALCAPVEAVAAPGLGERRSRDGQAACCHGAGGRRRLLAPDLRTSRGH